MFGSPHRTLTAVVILAAAMVSACASPNTQTSQPTASDLVQQSVESNPSVQLVGGNYVIDLDTWA